MVGGALYTRCLELDQVPGTYDTWSPHVDTAAAKPQVVPLVHVYEHYLLSAICEHDILPEKLFCDYGLRSRAVA